MIAKSPLLILVLKERQIAITYLAIISAKSPANI
jgi:hypothetical protein